MKKMLFLNIGWMKNYKGLRDDCIIGGGAFVRKYKYGHEIFNFRPYNGYMYGYVQPKGEIKIERLGASSDDESIKNVLAIWVARSPRGGVRIIGWYKNATVFRKWQPPPIKSNRQYKGKIGYYLRAKEKDARLLPMDERIFRIPRGKNGMGQCNIWYADRPENVQFRRKVFDYIYRGVSPNFISDKKKKKLPRQMDPNKLIKIEKIAIEMVRKHYEEIGYEVKSIEKDNMGWDLTASISSLKDYEELKIEVKGLSQSEILAELTPNEYQKMQKYRESYRICIVTNTLNRNRKLNIFSYSPERNRWEDEEGNRLIIRKIIGARLCV